LNLFRRDARRGPGKKADLQSAIFWRLEMARALKRRELSSVLIPEFGD
jgi:hypothetical protein